MAKDTTNDMTVGNPVKLIIRFMIPMCLGNIFQQFYNIVDSIVAGQFLGVDALAAIGSTGSLMFFVTGWLNGLSSGFAILVSQWFGAKQYDKMRHYVAMSIYLAAAFAIVMTIGFEALNEPILRLMNSPDELIGSVKGYMGIIYAGLIVTAAYNSLAAFLRALGDSRSPLYFLIISAVINVFLDVFLIVKCGMGVEGCAYATVIAQGISAICCFVYIVKKFPILHLKKEDFKISITSFRYLLALGIPMGLQFSITAIGTIIVQGAVNIYGSTYMAGFSAAGKLQNIIGTVFAAFGATIATYVGQNRGAGRMDRVRTGMRYTQFMILGWSVITMFVVFFFGKYMTWLFIDKNQTDVINVSVTYFRTVFWAYPFLGSIFLYRNGLQGLGYGLVPMVGGIFELVARSTIVMFVAGKTSFSGVCLADPVAWISALIPLIPYYIHVIRKWKKQEAARAKV
nr:MATE family efflux transporter [uncultured Blautia sp.]